MKALVTGAGGFLGGAIARTLVSRGWTVRSLSRGEYPDLARLQVEQVRGDVADEEAVRRACDGATVVFHAAAKVGLWGRYEDYRRVNVTGSRNVARGCAAAGVSRLVFTSSPSVVFDGRDVVGVDESAPYPRRFDSYYSQTKAAAEELVLAANSRGLATVALRPHLVWGPGDRHIVPRIVARARAGRLARIGRADKLVDTTFIDDAVEAHWLAAQRLGLQPGIGGRAYFISSGEPRPIWQVIDGLLRAAGLPPVSRSVPPAAARAAAWGCELAWRALRLDSEPPLTRFLVSQLETAHWFDISAARRELGYQPRVAFEEGLRRLGEWLRTGPLARA